MVLHIHGPEVLEFWSRTPILLDIAGLMIEANGKNNAIVFLLSTINNICYGPSVTFTLSFILRTRYADCINKVACNVAVHFR